jgi:hypothetical protein
LEREREKETKACIVVFVLYTRRIWTGQQTPGEYPPFFFSIQFNSIQKKEKKRREKEISIIITCTNTHRRKKQVSIFFLFSIVDGIRL